MSKITVQRAYIGSQRVLVDSEGRAYVGARDGWVDQPVSAVRVGHEYDSWSDVPTAWLGHIPYWSNRK